MARSRSIKYGDRVKVSCMDSEDGSGYEREGRVTTDWEKTNYEPMVDVLFDGGGTAIMIPKSICEKTK